MGGWVGGKGTHVTRVSDDAGPGVVKAHGRLGRGHSIVHGQGWREGGHRITHVNTCGRVGGRQGGIPNARSLSGAGQGPAGGRRPQRLAGDRNTRIGNVDGDRCHVRRRPQGSLSELVSELGATQPWERGPVQQAWRLYGGWQCRNLADEWSRLGLKCARGLALAMSLSAEVDACPRTESKHSSLSASMVGGLRATSPLKS